MRFFCVLFPCGDHFNINENPRLYCETVEASKVHTPQTRPERNKSRKLTRPRAPVHRLCIYKIYDVFKGPISKMLVLFYSFVGAFRSTNDFNMHNKCRVESPLRHSFVSIHVKCAHLYTAPHLGDGIVPRTNSDNPW